jgi:hypothetical protein
MTLPNRFFGGEASSIGQVSKLHVPNWTKFVQEVLGHPIPLNVTRAQFHALPKDRRNAIKRVAYVTPATFRTDSSKRLHELAKDISILALDIDDPRQARPFVNSPAAIADALSPLAFAAYTTASSTADAPKLRILVPAAHLPVKSYAAAVRSLAKRLGLPTVTKESLVAVQPMYLPTLFRGDDILSDHPLIIAELDGPAFVESDITATEAGPARKADSGPSDDIEHLRATVDDVELDDAESALKHLDPDCSYPEWLEVAAALRHQFPKQADEAYELFDRWSSKGEKYQDKADTEAKWKSLRTTPRGRAPITIRSLFSRAVAGGWQGATAVAEKTFSKLWSWIKDEKRTASELMSHGVKKIASAPLQGSVEQNTLLTRLRQVLSDKGMNVSVATLQKELRRLHRSQSTTKEVKPITGEQLPPWARGICYVAGSNEFYQRVTDKRFIPEVLDSVYGVHLMNADSESGRPGIRPRDFLLNVAKIPRVEHYRYDPSHPEQTFVTDRHHRYVNTYIPTYPEPDPDDADSAGAIITEHLTNLIAEPAYRQTILDYLTYCVQHPGKKTRWTILLQGAQGCGKTALAELMKSVLGDTNVILMDASLLFQPYNPWANGAQLVAMEEIRVVGHNRYEVMNRLKPCISNDTVMIRRMRTDAYQTPNMTNYIMFTNYHDSLAVTDEDRRYFVVNSALQNKAQVLDLGKKYFGRLYGCIANQAPGLRAWFEKLKISAEFEPNGHAPQTTYLTQLASAAATPLTAAIKDALQDAAHPLVRSDLVSTKALKAMLLLDETLPRFNDQQLATALRELDYVQLGRPRLTDGRHYLWARRGGTTVTQGESLARKRQAGTDSATLL